MTRKLDRYARWFNKIHQAVFHRTAGRVGARMLGVDLVALTTIGRRTGQRRTSMVGAPILEDAMVVVIASYAAGPTHPQWYFNLRADPAVEITARGRTRAMIAHEAEGAERDRLWARIAAGDDKFDKYQARTERRIPLIVLEPIPSAV